MTLFRTVVALPLLLFSSSASFACESVQTTVSTTPVVEQSPGRLKVANEKLEKLNTESPVLMAGDSIAFSWDGGSAKRDFGDLSVANFGVPGERTQELLWRIKQLANVNRIYQKIVLIIGTNNIGDLSATACGVAAGIEANVFEFTTHWPAAIVYVFPILPRGDNYAYRRQEISEINSSLKERYASSSRVIYVDVNEDEITCGWATGDCPYYRPDKLHPTTQGYQLLSKYLKDAEAHKSKGLPD